MPVVRGRIDAMSTLILKISPTIFKSTQPNPKMYQEVLVSVKSQCWQSLNRVGLEEVVLVPGLDEGDPDAVELVVDVLQAFDDRLAAGVGALAAVEDQDEVYWGVASHPAAPGSITCIPEIFSEEKLSMMLRLINGAG